jgi:hypothetical protein
MFKLKIKTGLMLVLVASFVLAACQQATPAAPTLDANAIYTQAAATVAAGLAQTQASQPTATTQPATPTFTNIPSTNLTPTSTLQPGTVSETLLPGTPSATVSVLTMVPTATGSGALPSVADKAEWVSQTPTDKTQVTKNSKFLIKYVFKNAGQTTWTTKYTFRYYAGNKLGSPNDLNLIKDVKPNETVEILFEATAPAEKGVTNTIWVLSNADGVNFYSVFLDLEIID